MILLAADTATAVNTVAVLRDGRPLAELIVDCGRGHSERLLECVNWTLREAGLQFDDVDALAVSVGPGSFTGVRIGVSAFKGLALARRLPLIPVSTMDALARCAGPCDGLVCPLLDAKMKEVYGALYRQTGSDLEKLKQDAVAPVEFFLEGLEQNEVLFLGDGATLYETRIREALPHARFLPRHLLIPRASAVAAAALDILSAGADNDAALVEPVYLRASQAEQARAQRERERTAS